MSWVRRAIALLLLADGLMTVVWGRGFLRWQRRWMPHWYKPALDWLLRWPEPLLRLGAAFEAVVGWKMWKDEQR
ncbi:hypothetical protein [Rhodothermus profundi]|uniref:Uncharacterized protein n=1 Tax=Rhodothermus profundi TaxID=633813 RepID=A0A1M6UPE7_9BACT|nr:hypothetical protein [Rhodothermus profundi]SHK71046.1 hypothetical protein SAMN04488087_1802 [Rhodothermus profundi]